MQKTAVKDEVRKIFEKKPEVYAAFEKTKDAFQYFEKHHPAIKTVYNNFHYYYTGFLKSLEKEGKIVIAAKTKAVKEPVGSYKAILDADNVKLDKEDDLELKVYDPNDSKFTEEDFVGMKTGKPIDDLISSAGGIMPGTTLVLTGESGTGKSTLAFDIQASLSDKMEENEVMALSVEMSAIDLEAEIRTEKKEWMRKVKHILLEDYAPEQYLRVVEKTILYGYKFLVIDSFEALIDKIVELTDMNGKQLRNYLMALIKHANNGKTKTGVKTAIILIQQYTKSGTFVGSNSLKHNTTGMLYLRIDKNNERYASFAKNRRNGKRINKKMYYSLDANNEVVYDVTRFEEDIRLEEVTIADKNNIEENKKKFTDLINNNQEQIKRLMEAKMRQEEDEEDEFMDDDDL